MRAAARRTLAFTLLMCLTGSAAWPATFIHGPYSGAPSADSITIGWEADAVVAARVEYGLRDVFEANGTLPEVVLVPAPMEESSDTTHIALAGLPTQADYAYRVVLEAAEEEIASEIGFFRTAPDPGTPVSFAVIADTQWQSEATNPLELVGNAIAADPTPFDFILHAGDVIESPSSYYWDHWFASFADMLRRAPFIPVLGNHEKNHRSYYEAFSLPPGAGKNDEQWWALHWGDVVVVGLDTNVSRVADYHAQQDWARAHLSGPEPHKFVIFHHPVFSSDAFHGSGYSYDLIYHPIFVEHGVDIVFNGHAHNYERLERDGVTYLVVGGGGATPRGLADEHVPESILALEGHYFYARVVASQAAIDVDVLSVATEPVDGGRLALESRRLDSFTVGEPQPKSFEIPWILLGIVAAGAAILLFRRIAN